MLDRGFKSGADHKNFALRWAVIAIFTRVRYPFLGGNSLLTFQSDMVHSPVTENKADESPQHAAGASGTCS